MLQGGGEQDLCTTKHRRRGVALPSFVRACLHVVLAGDPSGGDCHNIVTHLSKPHFVSLMQLLIYTFGIRPDFETTA